MVPAAPSEDAGSAAPSSIARSSSIVTPSGRSSAKSHPPGHCRGTATTRTDTAPACRACWATLRAYLCPGSSLSGQMMTVRPASGDQSALPAAFEPPDDVTATQSGNTLGSGISGLFAFHHQHGCIRPLGEAIESVQWSWRRQLLVAPFTLAPFVLTVGHRSDGLATVGVVPPGDPHQQAARGVGVIPDHAWLAQLVRWDRSRCVVRHRRDRTPLRRGRRLDVVGSVTVELIGRKRKEHASVISHGAPPACLRGDERRRPA